MPCSKEGRCAGNCKQEAKACPCLHTTPCDPQCTCAHPHMSAGCLRCCSYGSPEQQLASAKFIAAALALYGPR